jgi:hypothetical protein
MDGVCCIMIFNQSTDVMWQSRHISPQHNHASMKILSKNVTRWACTCSKASINDSMGVTDVVCRLHHLVNENYQQELGCHSSLSLQDGGEIADGRIAGLVALSSIFAKWVNLHWGIVCCLRKRMISWNRAKRSWASDGSPPALAQILGHWPWRLPFSWWVTWKSDSGCSHFQQARTSAVNLVILDFLSLLSLQGRWAGALRAAFLCTFKFC